LGKVLHLLDDVIGPCSPIAWGNSLFLSFKKNWENIRVFSSFDWPSSVCGSKVMAKTTKRGLNYLIYVFFAITLEPETLESPANPLKTHIIAYSFH